MPSSDGDPWSIGALEQTVLEYQGVGSDADVPRELRFARSIARLVAKRRLRPDSHQDPNALGVLVLAPEAPLQVLPISTRVHMLDQANDPLTGRLWITNETAAFGDFESHNRDGDELFSWVSELGLGAYPAIIYDPVTDGGQLRLYMSGLEQPGTVDVYSIRSIEPITYEAVREVIDALHESALMSPAVQSAGVRLWADADRHRVVRDAEARIHAQVRVALLGAFLNYRVGNEKPVPSGRYDVAIGYFDNVASTLTQYGIIELKVLRSFGSTGHAYSAHDSYVREGVIQAATYREDEGAVWAQLACFDMRIEADASDACMSAANDLADEQRVMLDRWQIYATSTEYRHSRIAS